MKILLFANTDWYLYNFRLPLANAIRNSGHDVVLVSPIGEYGPRLRKEGFHWISISMDRRSLNPFYELQVIWHLARIYAHEQPDLVHHFTIKCVIYGALAAEIAGIANRVHSVTGLGYIFSNNSTYARILRPVVRRLMRWVLRGTHTRLILQNPDDAAEFLGANLISSDRLRLIRGSGVNLGRFSPIDRETPRIVRVLLATRLLWDKGLGEYIEAARLLRKADCPAEFLIAGLPDIGNPASVNQETFTEWGKEGIVSALGHIEDMAGLLRDVDIVVLPSYREGVPRILLEAAATGLPIVTTDVPGCREIVEHNVNGILVPPKDVITLSLAIKRLVEHPELRKRMGIAGRLKATTEFSEQIVIDSTLSVYSESAHTA